METNTPTLDVEYPSHFEDYSKEIQQSILEYILQLTPIEKKAYSIAKDHLKSSFNILKSNGYNEWKKSQSK
jgi:hypothetical protein